MRSLFVLAITTSVLLGTSVDTFAQRGQGRRAGQRGQTQSVPGRSSAAASSSGISNVNAADLVLMWEEEKVARDVYTRLSQTYPIQIFRNISMAENQHMQAVERLVRSSAGAAVQLDPTPGVFTNAEYQQLYTSLVQTGGRSMLDALKVGAKIEEMDIADLQRLLAQTNEPAVTQVLSQLLRGSENHLRAFASQIARLGGSYEAEFLSQAEFDRIAYSSGGGQQGRGQGVGQAGGRGAGQAGGSSAQGMPMQRGQNGRMGRGQRGR